MAVHLEKALRFEFVLRDNGVVVTMGKASAVMLYEIAKAFAYSVSGYEDPIRNAFYRGEWITLAMLLHMPVDTSDCWQLVSVDSRVYDFWCQRIEQ